VIFRRQGRVAEFCGGKMGGIFYGFDTQKLGGGCKRRLAEARKNGWTLKYPSQHKRLKKKQT
jgi:hypothetical protein